MSIAEVAAEQTLRKSSNTSASAVKVPTNNSGDVEHDKDKEELVNTQDKLNKNGQLRRNSVYL